MVRSGFSADGSRLEVFDGENWVPLTRLPDA